MANANVGQIIYNLQDYQQSGGYISTSNSDVTTIIVSTDVNYDSNKINIFDSNIVNRYSSKQFTKLGIQATPGTQFILNENKGMIIGRSGIYELDEDIIITSLKFVRPRRYIKDDSATQIALTKGEEGFSEAEQTRTAALNALNAAYPGEKDSNYWSQYSIIQSNYEIAYNEALNYFNTGINGVYKLDTANPYQDLYNVIIDFLY